MTDPRPLVRYLWNDWRTKRDAESRAADSGSAIALYHATQAANEAADELLMMLGRMPPHQLGRITLLEVIYGPIDGDDDEFSPETPEIPRVQDDDRPPQAGGRA